ncbi:MAG TPA: hypothetical protein VH560_19060 [Polyangia bacterium]|nr:hypothetical protein [Polyangia bacterium]
MTEACYVKDIALVKIDFEQERSAPPDQTTTQEDVTGVGDSAFFRYADGSSEGDLYVVKENLSIAIYDYEGTGAPSTEACLTTIARAVLSANGDAN